MITVLLDSSFRDLAVGIAKNDVMIDQISYEAWQKQSELLIPELDKLLNRNHIERADISSIIVSFGPGSYTGVRIALTVAKVMAFALDIPLYAVSSLQALKVGEKPTIVLINARSERSYIGVYQGAKVIVQDTIMTNAEAKEYIASHPSYLISGDAEYLGIKAIKVNPLTEMLSLKKDILPVKDKLGLTPVYLKE
ncbi:MAG: tRNA (adenosine(37)-N6)-threonylcarbamoyltransferase complex dimerization subunit type 1 TsaB [Firmicutes bacterium]|nr:tRNA (adenosine(37)-N6)-threonylcarbamoyltransferase complex dimerization subunit type 1 TsaB [Bacillota bacterium]